MEKASLPAEEVSMDSVGDLNSSTLRAVKTFQSLQFAGENGRAG